MPESPTPVGPDSDGAAARRRLIGAGLAGLVGSLVLAGRAGATATPEQTTTAPPRQPTSSDTLLLGAAQRAELAAVALYDMTLKGRQLVGDERLVLTGIREAHQAYAQSLSAILGKAAPDIAEQLVVDLFGGPFGGPIGAMLEAANELENVLVATHTEIVGALQGTAGAALIASILVVEARHATVLADMVGVSGLDDLLINDAEPLATAEG